jgi:glutamate dehydrogenase/leucine dehydrogenase
MVMSTKTTPQKMQKAAAKFHADAGAKTITASKVKELIKSMGLRMDGDLPEELAKKVVQIIVLAGNRTLENKRTTIKPCDL